MSLAKALEAQRAAKQQGPRCSMCILLAGLPKPERDALNNALADKRYTTAAISRALMSEGHNLNATTVGRHRNKECKGYVPVE